VTSSLEVEKPNFVRIQVETSIVKNNLNIFYCTLLCAALSHMSGCITGQKYPDERVDPPPPPQSGYHSLRNDPTKFDFYRDRDLIGGIVNLSHSDVLTSAADQGKLPLREGILWSGLTLDKYGYLLFGDGSRIHKTCTVRDDGKSVVVSSMIRIERRNKQTINNGSATAIFGMEGNGDSDRVWSKTGGGSVVCNESKQGAKVDFTSPAGTRLDLSFKRERSETKVIAGGSGIPSPTKSIKAKGSSVITWASNDSSHDTKKTYVRNSFIEAKESKYQLSMNDKNGDKKIMDISISIPSDTPFVIRTERDRKSNIVVSKTIVSGQLNSKVETGGKMTLTYKNLKLNFTDRSCSIGSGTATVVISDDSSADVKTLTLSSKPSGGDGGGGSLRDSSGKEIDGFSLDPCESEDLIN